MQDEAGRTPQGQAEEARSSPRPTLGIVARLAGVSEITASRALRGGPHVSPTVQARVEAAARQIGYVRNRVAGALAGGPSNQVGVVVPSLSNIVFPDVLKGLEERLETAGYHPVLGVSNYDPDHEEKLIEGLLAWRPAAMVLAPAQLTARSRALLAACGVPVVELMDVDGDPVDMAVGISQVQCGKAMAYYLLGRGYRRMAYVGHDIGRDFRATSRLTGFRDALAEAGQAPVKELILDAPSSVGLGRDGLARLLAECSTPPDVVYFSNDDMAVGGVFHCMATGLSIPDGIAIAGFNGLDIGQRLPTPLTTIGSNRAKIGRRAAELVLGRIAGEEVPSRVDVGFSLIRGASA